MTPAPPPMTPAPPPMTPAPPPSVPPILPLPFFINGFSFLTSAFPIFAYIPLPSNSASLLSQIDAISSFAPPIIFPITSITLSFAPPIIPPIGLPPSIPPSGAGAAAGAGASLVSSADFA